MRAVFALLALVTVAAAPRGPSATEFTALRNAHGETCPPIRKLSCAALDDPTEFRCSWQEHWAGKKWQKSDALIARNGKVWEWLDGGPRCSALVQH